MLNTRIGYLALFSALFISGIAIYFSVAGLAAIFSAYAISIIIMGTGIELGKLVAVVWLHHNWHHKAPILKPALSFLVLGVMFITSMGIFGYLSKSHVEQTMQSQESIAQVQRIETEIARHNAILTRSAEKIRSYENNGSGVDASLNAQIDKEQARIDSAYDRVKPVIQVQLDIIAADEAKTEARTKPYQDELDAVTQQLADLQTALNNKEIRTAQGIVGTKPDGSYRGKTEKAIKDFRTRNEARRSELLQKIDNIRSTPSIASKSAQEEITRIRDSAQSEIDESNSTIKRLRSRMGKSNANDIETLITSERAKIKESNVELDVLTQEKYKLEAGHRQLEAEVGPLKYIAEFVYSTEADAKLLEKAVQWLIILIIFVFDPFAIFLLIAAQQSFNRARKERKAGAREPEYTIEELLNDYEPEPVMPENETVKEWESSTYSDYFSDDEIIMDIQDEKDNISLVRSADGYTSFNGKVYANAALKSAHPELNLDFSSPIKSVSEFPDDPRLGDMILRVDLTPTQLFIFNGRIWNQIDKNILSYSAYSHEYIKILIKLLGNNKYNPEFLNAMEKQHIEDLLERK
jgi:hypothetical protein